MSVNLNGTGSNKKLKFWNNNVVWIRWIEWNKKNTQSHSNKYLNIGILRIYIVGLSRFTN